MTIISTFTRYDFKPTEEHIRIFITGLVQNINISVNHDLAGETYIFDCAIYHIDNFYYALICSDCFRTDTLEDREKH